MPTTIVELFRPAVAALALALVLVGLWIVTIVFFGGVGALFSGKDERQEFIQSLSDLNQWAGLMPVVLAIGGAGGGMGAVSLVTGGDTGWGALVLVLIGGGLGAKLGNRLGIACKEWSSNRAKLDPPG